MKYALISDVHANLPALESVLDDITARGIGGVAGNYDSTVATDYKHCGCRNTGSVGRPKDGDWRAGYVLLEASTLPSEFADCLRAGGRLTTI